MEAAMKLFNPVGILILILSVSALPQNKPAKSSYDEPIRISTELVQLDVVVTDKNGQVVRGLTKNDFELYEEGKKQLIRFFDLVDAVKGEHSVRVEDNLVDGTPGQGPVAANIHRIFAFVIDDLETRYSDLVYVREMLSNFVESQMQPGDLVAIIRTLGGKGLLQQFTTDKDLLRRAIASIGPTTNPLNVFDSPEDHDRKGLSDVPEDAELNGPENYLRAGLRIRDRETKLLRAFMSLGTAGFVVDSMKQLPGRKSMILVSSGLPIVSTNRGDFSSNASWFLISLVDKATRAGVAISTIDVRGQMAHKMWADFGYTPPGLAFSATPDDRAFGFKNPFDVMEAHQGLRVLASETGGISVLNRNNFNEGLHRIVSASDAYYLLAYTPSDSNFKGRFRNVEIKVRNKDLKVYGGRGYFAREDKPSPPPATKQEQVLAAIKSPLLRSDLNFDAMILFPRLDKGTLEIGLLVDPKGLQFEEVNGKQQASYEVVGFLFDERAKLRGGFSNTVTARLTPDEYNRAATEGGLPFTTTTTVPPGVYQLRLAVRDDKTGNMGTLSRYLEIPNVSKGEFAAGSLMLGAVAPGDTRGESTAISANGRISAKQDLRYAVAIYNPKLKDGKPQVKTQLVISQNGKVIYKEPEKTAQATGNAAQAMGLGQLGLSRVAPGRYTATLIIMDTLADKKTHTLTRSMEFVVED
jgi:VWFA-related protein